MITPCKLDAAGILLGNNAVFVALHSESDGGAGGDSIQPISITDVVGHINGFQIVVQAHRAESRIGLILGAPGSTRIVIFDAGFHPAFALDGTLPAARMLFQIGYGGVWSKLRDIRKIDYTDAAPVLDRRIAAVSRPGGHTGGAVGVETVEVRHTTIGARSLYLIQVLFFQLHHP